MFTFFFFFKQKTAYEMRISDWSSDVCSSDLDRPRLRQRDQGLRAGATLGGECRRCRSGIAGEHLRATKGIVECGAARIAGHLGHIRLFLANFENGRVLRSSLDVVCEASWRLVDPDRRTEERRGGKGGVSTCRSR